MTSISKSVSLRMTKGRELWKPNSVPVGIVHDLPSCSIRLWPRSSSPRWNVSGSAASMVRRVRSSPDGPAVTRWTSTGPSSQLWARPENAEPPPRSKLMGK